MSKPSSPCINECYLEDGVCGSCGRTREQIVMWGCMSEKEKQEIMEQL